MVGWHHQLNGHEFEQAPGVGDGQGGLACCSPWGRKESDTAEQMNCTELLSVFLFCFVILMDEVGLGGLFVLLPALGKFYEITTRLRVLVLAYWVTAQWKFFSKYPE